MTRRLKLGIVALQGAFIEHKRVFESLGAECVEIRAADQIEACDGLVLPGGESTTQGKLARDLGVLEPLRRAILQGVPTFATCAGLILLAERVSNDAARHIGTFPCVARRNAFGRQNSSFRAPLEVASVGEFPCVFIRAPYLESVGSEVEVLARCRELIVGARYKNQWCFAFHPELSGDDRLARLFLANAASFEAERGRAAR